MINEANIRDEDLQLLLNDLHQWYGYDFSDYAKASLKRRINRLWAMDKFPSFAELRYKLQTDKFYLKRFVEQITVNVTEMFRDPSAYQFLREEVLPYLGTHPLIRIWLAGCSTGEEAFSIAILLKEAGILHKSLLYATDINPDVLEKAKKGIFPLSNMKQYSENYLKSGGKHDFSSYYIAQYGRVKFDASLAEKMVFASHNLVSDRSFNEFQLILCRNVLIYFEKQLQDKVLNIFDESLEPLGYLMLGGKESIKFWEHHTKYSSKGKEKIWRKTS